MFNTQTFFGYCVPTFYISSFFGQILLNPVHSKSLLYIYILHRYKPRPNLFSHQYPTFLIIFPVYHTSRISVPLSHIPFYCYRLYSTKNDISSFYPLYVTFKKRLTPQNKMILKKCKLSKKHSCFKSNS